MAWPPSPSLPAYFVNIAPANAYQWGYVAAYDSGDGGGSIGVNAPVSYNSPSGLRYVTHAYPGESFSLKAAAYRPGGTNYANGAVHVYFENDDTGGWLGDLVFYPTPYLDWRSASFSVTQEVNLRIRVVPSRYDTNGDLWFLIDNFVANRLPIGNLSSAVRLGSLTQALSFYPADAQGSIGLSSALTATPGIPAALSSTALLRASAAATRGVSVSAQSVLRLYSTIDAATAIPPRPHAARSPVWLEIDDEPTASFWREPAATALQTAPIGWPVLSSVGVLRHPLIIPGLSGGESANASITLDDATGLLARRWAVPPIRRSARVQCPAGTLLSGLVTGWTGGPRTVVQIDGGQRWALTDPLPLRTSAVWGAWKSVLALPIVYGQATLRPVQYDQQGKVFLLADHPISGVDGVTRDDVPTAAWALHNAVDSTGHPCAFLELDNPLASGERLSVTLRGKLHPVSGQALQFPHDILHDLVTRVLGLPLDAGSLDLLRSQYGDWRIGCVFADVRMTQRQAIDAVTQSIGAAWSADSPDFARRWPDTAATARIDVTPLSARDAQAACQHSDIATVLRVLYDLDNATGEPRRAVQLIAPEAIARYGRIEREWQAPFLRSPRQAQELGSRLLQWISRPVWALQWTMADTDLAAGDGALLAHPALPIQGIVTLTDVQRDVSRATLTLQAQAAAGDAPGIVTERLSSSFDPIIQSGLTVDYANGTAVFTLLGDKGEPLSGAKVLLDGKTTRYADGAGRVTFEATRGNHQLHITAQGYAPMDVDVTA